MSCKVFCSPFRAVLFSVSVKLSFCTALDKPFKFVCEFTLLLSDPDEEGRCTPRGRLLTDPPEEGSDDDGGAEERCLSWDTLFTVPPEEGSRVLAGTLLVDADADEGGCRSRGVRLATPEKELGRISEGTLLPDTAAEAGCWPRGTVFADPADEGECIAGGGGMYRGS